MNDVTVPFAHEDSLQQVYLAEHPAMATVYQLYVYAESPLEAGVYADIAFSEIDRIEGLLSAYRAQSEISRINREAGEGTVTTDPETFRFLHRAFQWSERSGGAFDITVGALMKAWGFSEGNGAVPTAEMILAAAAMTGWQKVELDAERRTVRFASPGMKLDPGGIGKGYAVERAIGKLRAKGVPAALLSAGSSSIYALGQPPGESGWKVQVPRADGQEGVLSTVMLRDASLSTANTTAKYFVEDGQNYGSIMDPRTFKPVQQTLQVTVIHPSATDSDALSNALFCLSKEDRASFLSEELCSTLVVSRDQAGVHHEMTRWPAEVELSDGQAAEE